jgi:hypothetical protein
MTEETDTLYDAIEKIKESVIEFVGNDKNSEEKSKAAVVACGIWFFKLTDVHIKPENKEDFIKRVHEYALEAMEEAPDDGT